MVIKGKFSKKSPKPIVKVPKSSNQNIVNISALKRKPHQQEATNLLYDISNIVAPLMKEYDFKVINLCEMSPKSDNLLGLNVNRGQKIYLRLRPPNNDDVFLPKEDLIGTMLHELTHNIYGAHDAKFYSKLDELIKKQEIYMEKGINGFNIPFSGEGNSLGGVNALDYKKLRLQKLEKSFVMGVNKLGGGEKKGLLRDLVREAAIKRYEDNKWCNEGKEGDLPNDDDLILLNNDEIENEEENRKRLREDDTGVRISKKTKEGIGKSPINQVPILIEDEDEADYNDNDDNHNDDKKGGSYENPQLID